MKNLWLHESREEYQFKVVHLPTFSKTVIAYVDEVNSKDTLLEKYIKYGELNAIIILSYLQEGAKQLLDKIIKITKSTYIRTIILYYYFHGFNFVRLW